MSAPSAKAFRFVIDGTNQQYDAYLDLVPGAGSERLIDCRYRAVGATADKWVWLTSPIIYLAEVDTTENADEAFDRAIAEINKEIEEVFGTVDSDVPLKGFARIEWLIQVGIKEVNNVISRL